MQILKIERFEFGKGSSSDIDPGDRGGIRRITIKDARGLKCGLHIAPEQLENFIELLTIDSNITIKKPRRSNNGNVIG